jgi:hypothetical protein
MELLTDLRQYAGNVAAWWRGWRRFGEIGPWKPKYGPRKLRWLALYLFNIGANVVLLAGPVQPISRTAHDHRDGAVWDAILDVIERRDPGHGAAAMGPLWGTREPPLWVRIAVPVTWALLALGLALLVRATRG